MFDKAKLDPWLRRQLWGKKANELVSFQLLHQSPTGASLLEEVTLPTEKIEDADVFINDIIDLMKTDVISTSESNGGVQNFAICANFGEDNDSVYFKFRHALSAFENDNVGGSEPANAQGLLAQTQRHLEVRERTTWGMVSTIMSNQQRMLDKYQEGFERLLDRQMDVMKASEDILSKKHERDIDLRKQERKDKTVSDITDKFMALLPIAVYKLTGKNIMGADTAANNAVADSFIESIGEEQFEKMVSGDGLNLEDHQRMLFITLLEDYQKRMKSKVKQLRSSTQTQRTELPPKPETAS